tara:strand:- start:1126 stop:3453 length:2328 start_codon:yes stop_codon:yes gene_type:complete
VQDSTRAGQTVITLSFVDHEFSINEDGTILLTIQYIGALQSLLDLTKANVLMTGGAFGSAGSNSPFGEYHRNIRMYEAELKRLANSGCAEVDTALGAGPRAHDPWEQAFIENSIEKNRQREIRRGAAIIGAGGFTGVVLAEALDKEVYTGTDEQEEELRDQAERELQQAKIDRLNELVTESMDTLRRESMATMFQFLMDPRPIYPEVEGKRLMYTIPITKELIGRFANNSVLPDVGDYIDASAIGSGDIAVGPDAPQEDLLDEVTEAQLETAASAPGYLEHVSTRVGAGAAIGAGVGAVAGAGVGGVPGWAVGALAGLVVGTATYLTREEAPPLDNYDAISAWDPNDPTTHYINYFYLGDLVDILAFLVLGNTDDSAFYSEDDDYFKAKYAFKKEQVQDAMVLMGPMTVTVPSLGIDMPINISDIPISVRMFVEFFQRNVIEKDRMVYPFYSFVKDLIDQVAVRALGADCFSGIHTGGQQQINTTTLNGPPVEGSEDPIYSRYLEEVDTIEREQGIDDVGDSPSAGEGAAGVTARLDLEKYGYTKPIFTNNMGASNQINSRVWKYLVFSQPEYRAQDLVHPSQREEESELDPLAADRQRGIHHLHIGRDSGLVKSVSFSKSANSSLMPARLEREGEFNPLNQLAEVYNVTITMFGNTLFRPGQIIYINPFGLAPTGGIGQPHDPKSISNIMGLGGYHSITRVSSYIESGKFETVIEATWQNSGAKKREQSNVSSDDKDFNCPAPLPASSYMPPHPSPREGNYTSDTGNDLRARTQ